MQDVTFRKKAMISQTMNGLTKEEIEEDHKKARRHLERLGYIVIETYISKEAKENPIYCLSLELEHMAQCDAVYFCDGWENYTMCGFEHMIAEEYGLDIIYAEDEEDPEAPITDEQKVFLEGMNHTEIVLDAYFDMILDAWSGCSDEYQRSAKIIKNGVIKWLTAAKFERYTDFVKENEAKVNE